ncbi:MAG: phosphodiester glycosidase family protein [Lautropia sp.]|nr:phosphodiester glycosidase family protein [Lautropia sp.]
MKSAKSMLMVSACLSAMGLAGCSDGGSTDAGTGQPVQESAGAKDDAGGTQQGNGSSYGAPGTTYLSESDRKLLQELKGQGPQIEQAEVELHAINVGAGAISLNALKSVELCADSECQPLNITTTAGKTIAATTDGTALALGKTTLKAGTFTHLKVRLSDANGKDVEKSLKFRDPVPANLLATKVQALLAIGRSPGCEGEDCLQAVSAASLPGFEGAEYVYYNPTTGSARKAQQHLDVNMPPGMLKEAEIFAAMVTDTGGMHPHVEIMPRVNLFAPMKAEIHSYADGKNRFKSYDEGKSLGLNESQILEVENPYELRVVGKGGADDGLSGKREIKRIDTCIERLDNAVFKRALKNLVSSGGMYYQDPGVCQNVPPNVHIAITLIYGNGMLHDVVFDDYSEHKYATVRNSTPIGVQVERYDFGQGVSLRRVDDFPGFDILINGFLWEGNKAFSWDPDPVGRPLGYVKGLDVANDERLVIGRNTDENGDSDGPKRVVEILEGSVLPRFSLLTTTDYVGGDDVRATLSSDSSILVEGKCRYEAEFERRSAVGFAPDGLVVFVSSSGDSKTDNNELCEIFKALDVTWAVRMDGGTAASMSVNGSLVNPLGGFSALAFGQGRRVAWAFGARSELPR